MIFPQQEKGPVRGKPQCILKLTGQDLIGIPLRSPRCAHEQIYALPLLTILMNKGTGIVTSVPSDSPDDYAALCDLKKKPKLREKYGVCDEWVMPFEVGHVLREEATCSSVVEASREAMGQEYGSVCIERRGEGGQG